MKGQYTKHLVYHKTFECACGTTFTRWTVFCEHKRGCKTCEKSKNCIYCHFTFIISCEIFFQLFHVNTVIKHFKQKINTINILRHIWKMYPNFFVRMETVKGKIITRAVQRPNCGRGRSKIWRYLLPSAYEKFEQERFVVNKDNKRSLY